MKNRILSAIILFLILIAPHAAGNIYKCVSEDGVVKFSDAPCSEQATVAFESSNRHFDEVIDNGSPYPNQPVKNHDMDIQKVRDHAKRISQTVIPGETIRKIKQLRSHMMPGWTFILELGPPADKAKYTVSLDYSVRQTAKGTYIWLQAFRVRMNNRPYDPPSMANVKKYKKAATGRWEILQR